MKLLMRDSLVGKEAQYADGISEVVRAAGGFPMTQLLLIPQRLPALNDMLWKQKFRFQKLKADTEAMIAYEIRRQHLKPMRYAYVSFLWAEENQKRDPDNICAGAKFCLDALVNCQILPGDGWAHILSLTHQFVRHTESYVQVSLSDKR